MSVRMPKYRTSRIVALALVRSPLAIARRCRSAPRRPPTRCSSPTASPRSRAPNTTRELLKLPARHARGIRQQPAPRVNDLLRAHARAEVAGRAGARRQARHHAPTMQGAHRARSRSPARGDSRSRASTQAAAPEFDANIGEVRDARARAVSRRQGDVHRAAAGQRDAHPVRHQEAQLRRGRRKLARRRARSSSAGADMGKLAQASSPTIPPRRRTAGKLGWFTREGDGPAVADGRLRARKSRATCREPVQSAVRLAHHPARRQAAGTRQALRRGARPDHGGASASGTSKKSARPPSRAIRRDRKTQINRKRSTRSRPRSIRTPYGARTEQARAPRRRRPSSTAHRADSNRGVSSRACHRPPPRSAPSCLRPPRACAIARCSPISSGASSSRATSAASRASRGRSSIRSCCSSSITSCSRRCSRRERFGNESFLAFVAVALWPWLAAQEGIQRGATSLGSYAGLIRKVAFPHELVVYASVGATLHPAVRGLRRRARRARGLRRAAAPDGPARRDSAVDRDGDRRGRASRSSSRRCRSSCATSSTC